MRAGAHLGWRVAVVVAFGATAALAVAVSRAVPQSAGLASGNGPGTLALASHCVTTGLRISVGPGEEEAAVAQSGSAGAIPAITAYTVDFTNVSGAPCALSGYPEIAVYEADAAGTVIGGGAGHLSSVGARRVLLAPGQTAYAFLDAWTAAPRCRLVRAAGLRVIPPGESVARYIPHPLATCAAGGRASLRVNAVQPGPGPHPR